MVHGSVDAGKLSIPSSKAPIASKRRLINPRAGDAPAAANFAEPKFPYYVDNLAGRLDRKIMIIGIIGHSLVLDRVNGKGAGISASTLRHSTLPKAVASPLADNRVRLSAARRAFREFSQWRGAAGSRARAGPLSGSSFRRNPVPIPRCKRRGGPQQDSPVGRAGGRRAAHTRASVINH
ncbi:hypothetical protein KM043_008743 [Ampulex compressa]|nr:hypothetical protein KM043_008743 [Ampulex compressa]